MVLLVLIKKIIISQKSFGVTIICSNVIRDFMLASKSLSADESLLSQFQLSLRMSTQALHKC